MKQFIKIHVFKEKNGREENMNKMSHNNKGEGVSSHEILEEYCVMQINRA